MVRGLDKFQNHFSAYDKEFVLIGGTAATLAMENAGLEFRATKDLDIVLHVEVLSVAFGEAFWAFIEAGKYQIRQEGTTKKPVFYRFQKPENNEYPSMLELFSRAPTSFEIKPGSHLTPIPIDESVSSLSAILMNDDYYQFIVDGRKVTDGLPHVDENQLIPLKARAWIDLTARQKAGEHVDSKNIRKHGYDTLRLAQLLTPDSRIVVPQGIHEDLKQFLSAILADPTIDPKSVEISGSKSEICDRIDKAYVQVQ